MELFNQVKLYFFQLLAFFLIDLVWLSIIAKSFYQKYLGFLLRPSPNLLPATIFYLLFVLGNLVFAVLPGLDKNSLAKTLGLAALFGLMCYSTYDLSNWATIKNWPWQVVAVDIIWGTVLSAGVGLVGFLIGQKL
jgi:uncharacterized membrane protein